MYCSELVWKIYDEALGIRLGRLQTLKEFDLKDPIVEAKMRERYGGKIPGDQPVISPAEILAAEELVTVTQR